MKLYFKNDKPFLPLESSEKQAKQQFYIDLINEFNLDEYIKYMWSEHYVEVFGMSIPMSDVVDGLSSEKRNNLRTLYSVKHTEKILNSNFDKLQIEKDLNINSIIGMNEYENNHYHVFEFDGALTHEAVMNYLKSKLY
jgi:hypothetical protein